MSFCHVIYVQTNKHFRKVIATPSLNNIKKIKQKKQNPTKTIKVDRLYVFKKTNYIKANSIIIYLFISLFINLFCSLTLFYFRQQKPHKFDFFFHGDHLILFQHMLKLINEFSFN